MNKLLVKSRRGSPAMLLTVTVHMLCSDGDHPENLQVGEFESDQGTVGKIYSCLFYVTEYNVIGTKENAEECKHAQ